MESTGLSPAFSTIPETQLSLHKAMLDCSLEFLAIIQLPVAYIHQDGSYMLPSQCESLNISKHEHISSF